MGKAATVTCLLALVACERALSPVGPQLTSPSLPSASSVGSDPSRFSRSAEGFPFERILCFGDSITEGVTSRTLDGQTSLARVEGYVTKLRRRLKREYGEGIELINSGVGAEDTSEGRERIGRELRLFRPDLVLLLEGVMDVNNPRPRFNDARANLREMIEIVLDNDTAIIIGTYIPLNEEGFRNRGIDNVPRLNEIIREEAAKLGVPVADHEEGSQGDTSLQGPDGLHPNDNGYRVMAETWFGAVQQLVSRLTT